MWLFVLKAIVSGVLVAAISTVAKRYPGWGGLIASLPMVSLLSMLWLYGETRDETRERIMLTFNTPFYPEILIASSVMAEGVDLHLNCRHVIHHDLDWNPSSLEQRTGRIDRLGAKAERSGQSIRVYLPYVEGCQDEKLFRVVMDRERWFGVVMGAEESMSRILKATAWEIERLALELPVPLSLVGELRLRLSAEVGAGSQARYLS